DFLAVTRQDLAEFLTHLSQQNLNPRSVARILTTVKGFYRFLKTDELIDGDPTECLPAPKAAVPLPNYLSQADVERLLQQPDTADPIGLRNKTMLEALYATGLRVSELIALRVHDLNVTYSGANQEIEHGYLVCFGKGRKERIVPVAASVIRLIQEYMATA